MANNIPGISRRIQPRAVVRVRDLQRGGAVNAGDRVLCIMGEGLREELLVDSANGGGADGVNADYSASNNPDGRHFQISQVGLIGGRTEIIKNGASLRVLEAQINTNPFDSRFDVRVDNTTGRVELQQAHLVSVGGDSTTVQYWSAGATNIGNGNPVITSSSLLDQAAPQEAWTFRCVSIVRDGLGNPIPGQATFSVSGSTSGNIKDINGNPIQWKSDGVLVSNGILNFSIIEGTIRYEVGDRFTVHIDSGVLAANDQLEAKFIAELDTNDPQLFLDPQDIYAKHGQPSETNTLSLGTAMAFENGAPAVLALQAKPPVPRRSSEVLILADDPLTTTVTGATGNDDIEDTIFPLPVGVRPDANTTINVFVVNSDGTEEQLLFTKQAFYNTAYGNFASAYSGFVKDAGISQQYTVLDLEQVEQTGNDGYVEVLSSNTITFTCPTCSFSDDRLQSGEGDVGKNILFFDPVGLAGAAGSFARYNITSVGDGYGDNTVVTATLVSGPDPTVAAPFYGNVRFDVVDTNQVGAYLAITDDIAINNLTAGKGLRISFINEVDATFFDTNWTSALDALETADCQIVVPLPLQSISNIFQATRIHVETMSQPVNAKERVAIIGSIRGLTSENLIGTTLAAVEDIGILEGIQGDDPEEVLAGNIEDLANYSVPDAFGGTFRVLYMHPDEVIRNIKGQNTVIAGYFMAAALGGFWAGINNVNQPLTNKILSGFTILRNQVEKTLILDNLADAGVLMVEPVAGGGRMLHGLTTIQSGAPEQEEASIVAIRDQVARGLRKAVSPYVGRPSTPQLLAAVSATIQGSLEGFVNQGMLATIGQVTVARDSIEPRQINITADVAPVGPVNWVFVDITVSL